MNNYISSRFACGAMLHGRRGFFFEADNGLNPQGSNQQQQQNGNQQQQQQAADPFAAIDLDLLDEPTRLAITQARTQFATVAKQAELSTQFQSRYDSLQAQIQREKAEAQLQQQHQNAPKELSLEDEMLQEYLANGIPADQAKNLAKMNGNILSKFGNRIGNVVQGQLQPMQQSVMAQSATQIFQQQQMQDPRLQDPAIAQMTWDRVQQLTQQGVEITPHLLTGLAKIFYVDSMDQQQQNQQQHQQPPQFQQQFQQAPPVLNQQTRYTFPGSGMLARAPQQQQQQRQQIVDQDTLAAVNATTSSWQTQYGITGKGKSPSIITRG